MKDNLMTPEQMIAECKRRYPIGTVFKCSYSGDEETVEEYNYYECGSSKFDGVHSNDCWMYLSDDGWAKVISYPGKPPIKELYKIY